MFVYVCMYVCTMHACMHVSDTSTKRKANFQPSTVDSCASCSHGMLMPTYTFRDRDRDRDRDYDTAQRNLGTAKARVPTLPFIYRRMVPRVESDGFQEDLLSDTVNQENFGVAIQAQGGFERPR
jgi:hypothetical protein